MRKKTREEAFSELESKLNSAYSILICASKALDNSDSTDDEDVVANVGEVLASQVTSLSRLQQDLDAFRIAHLSGPQRQCAAAP